MTKDEVSKTVLDIISPKEDEDWGGSGLEVKDVRMRKEKGQKVLSFRTDAMYCAANLNFPTMCALVKAFDGKDLNIDGFSSPGCETCDFGSHYGHDVDIIGVNIELVDDSPKKQEDNGYGPSQG